MRAEPAAGAAQVGASGPVTVTVRHGQVVAVEFGPAWLATAAPDAIGAHLRDALRQALTGDTGDFAGAVEQLRAFIADPGAYPRRLGPD